MLRQLVRRSSAIKGQVRYSAWNFQNTVESRVPIFKGRPNREGADLQKAKDALPKIVFMTSYEFDLLTKARSNVVPEYIYQRETRLKIAELFLKEAPEKLHGIHVSDPAQKTAIEMKALQNFSEYAGDLLEQQMQNVQRINDFVDSNPVYLLEQPLREEARWNMIEEMDNTTRAAVRTDLRNFLPSQYQQVKAADFQQVAAFSAEVRAKMLAAIDEHAEQCEREDIANAPEAEKEKLLKILKGEVMASKNFIDPTYKITTEAIDACDDSNELREMAHKIADYNGDERMLTIYARAAKLSGDSIGQTIVSQMQEVVYAWYQSIYRTISAAMKSTL